MKTFVLFLSLMLPLQSVAQEYLKKNITILYDKIPAPPSDINSAEKRLNCTGDDFNRACKADVFYQSITDSINAIKLKLETINIALNAPDASAIQNLNPEEIQKKMATMTQAEQIDFAMKLNQQMGFGPKALTPEPETVTEAIEVYSELSMTTAMEVNDPSTMFQKRLKLMQERDEKHRAVNEWHTSEAEKLPQVSFGEAGRGPEPKAEYALKMATADKHLAAENEFLQAVQKFWSEYTSHLKNRYMPFQQKLEAIRYGEEIENIENKRILMGGQSTLLAPADDLLAFSKEATEGVAQWLILKQSWEKQKPVE